MKHELEYLDIKRAIESTKADIQNWMKASLVAGVMLEALEKELKKYKPPKTGVKGD